MLKLAVVAVSLAAASGFAQTGAPAPVAMPDLTVPQERLPAGCGLVPVPSTNLEGNSVRSGPWGGLPIDTNPWTGTDRSLIVSLRERMDGPPLAPDGPPLGRGASSRYLLHLADGVDEGYAAFYTPSGAPESATIAVYALRFAGDRSDAEYPSHARRSRNPAITRIEMGPVVAVVHGDQSECSAAIATYLTSRGK